MFNKKDSKIEVLNCDWRNISLSERSALQSAGAGMVILPCGANFMVFSPFSESTHISVPEEWRKSTIEELSKRIGIEGIVRFGADEESIIMNSLANARRMAEILISI